MLIYNRDLRDLGDFSYILSKMEANLHTEKLAKFYLILLPPKTLKDQSILTFNFCAKIPPIITF